MSIEYLDLSDSVYEEIENIVRATYKNACIVWIEKINNPELETKFNTYQSTIHPPNVMRLFHGTGEDVSRIIIRDGFDPRFNKTSAFGKGVYFSKRAQYSKEYARVRNDGLAFMFVCDVVTGKVGLGVSNKPIPQGFNSVTDNLKRPDMYIVNKKEAAIPRYLVGFHPTAT